MKSTLLLAMPFLLIPAAMADDYNHAAYVDMDAGICLIWNADQSEVVAVDDSRFVATQDTTTGDMNLECTGYVDPPSDGRTAVLQGFSCSWTSPFWGPMETTDSNEVILKSGKAKMKCHFQLSEPACQNHVGVACPPDITDGLYVFMWGGFINYELPCPPVWSATWDWGDGNVDEFFQMPDGYVYPFPNDHTYAEPGSYNVDIRLFDEDGHQLDQTQCQVFVE